METVLEELGIPKQHIIQQQSCSQRCCVVVSKDWIRNIEIYKKLCPFPVNHNLITFQQRNFQHQLHSYYHIPTNLDHQWTKILIQSYKKYQNVANTNSTTATNKCTTKKCISLPKHNQFMDILINPDTDSTKSNCKSSSLLFSQILAFISLSNYKNLWEHAYVKYENAHENDINSNGSANMNINSRKNEGRHLNRKNDTNINFMEYDAILRDIIQRVYGCNIIHAKLDRLKKEINSENHPNFSTTTSTGTIECHQNLLPVIAAIETSSHFLVLFYPSKVEFTLYDCITYSPAILSKSFNKPFFIVYQLIQIIKNFHSRGLLIGDLRLHDIYLQENLWLQIIPNLEVNLIQLDNDLPGFSFDRQQDCDINESIPTKFDLKSTFDFEQFMLREYTEKWCKGQLSNFDYLTILNNAAGRRLDCPSYHHIMPWVTDFTYRNGEKWRDLTKSKYRLNKGDPHLDLMFNQSTETNVPHHVAEFLSEITYYVYMARRTPKEILCQHVRPIWVPAEYPISIQRLQEWTPDECIPEFYSDPQVFKSIHEDLPDLELPIWATCPEDFIAKHREALESQYVSERLHHWIDLNFGYKLTGKAAIKSKNVCLSLVDNHQNLIQKGIVQLFTQPHPPKRFSWFNRNPPRLSTSMNITKITTTTSQNLSTEQKRRMARSSEDLTTASKYSIGGDKTTCAAPTTSPRKSNSSYSQKGFISQATLNDAEINSGNIERSTSYHTNVNRSSVIGGKIYLPKDYNPVAQLSNLENMQTFFAKTYLDQNSSNHSNEDHLKRLEQLVQNNLLFHENYSSKSGTDCSFTNRIFSEMYEAGHDARPLKNSSMQNFLIKNHQSTNFKTILQDSYTRELQVIGCLLVEIFLMNKLRPMLMNFCNSTFEERLKCCRMVIKHHLNDLPKCMQIAIKLCLEFDQNKIKDETELPSLKFDGLVKPTATQILQLLFNTNLIISFPRNYLRIYSLITNLHNFEFNENLLQIYTYFNCDGTKCLKYDDLDRKRVLFSRKIAECKVKSTSIYMESLLDAVGYEQFKAVELLLPHVIDLIKSEETSILSAWLLFDPIAMALGVKDAKKYLLEPILHLYDADIVTVTTNQKLNKNIHESSSMKFTISSSFKSRKSVKLYHHSFLLRLIVRFGLKCFLENFIAPLIEAVGGFKEPEESTGLHYHSNVHSEKQFCTSRSTKNLRFCCNENNDDDNSITLISHDCFSTDNTISLHNSEKNEIEGIFAFENENDDLSLNSTDKICCGIDGDIKSLDSFETRISNLSAEEATEDLSSFRPQKLAIDDIIYTGSNKNKLSNNSSFDEDRSSLNSRNDVSDDTIQNSQDGPIKSPTIPIPNTFRRTYELSTIDCEIGSKKSTDSIDLISRRTASMSITSTEAMNKKRDETEIHSQQSRTLYNNDIPQSSMVSKSCGIKTLRNTENSNRISEMSTESLIWLSHRLGPVLTARYLTRNLLKMLTLCYVGQENLLPDDNKPENTGNLNYFTIADSTVVGDRNALKVLECLTSIAALFGEQFILSQYLPHFGELIALSKKRITSSLEGALISSLQLIKYMVPCLMDSTIMEQLQDVILDTIIHPILLLLGSTKSLMPSGFLSRSVLARKLLDTIYVISVRIGPEMSKDHLCIPALQRFFIIFDKAYGISDNFQKQIYTRENISPPNLDELSEDSVGGSDNIDNRHLREKTFDEIRDVFSPNLAHTAYIAFLKFLGESIMQRTILNLELILTLCHEHEEPNYLSSDNRIRSSLISNRHRHRHLQNDDENSNTFGTSVIGNRIEVTNQTQPSTTTAAAAATTTIKHDPMEVLDMIAYKFDQINTTRHLRGNWLAYWEHEIGRSDKDTHLNIKQIKLQQFNGHTNTVRSILCLDNENSFMSASKDKTVKLWSLRSEGDGKKITSCQFTYNYHKKSVHSLAFLESMRYAVSCDSGVHLWDPFIGRPVAILDSQTKHSPVSIVRTYPSPSSLILAGTSESTVKMIDARIANYVSEWKITSAQNSIVRCLACSPSGNWLAVGLSSGSIILLDSRTGMILGSFKATDGELLQLVAANDQQLISSSLDHSISVWSVNDNSLQYQLKQAPEPAHCLYPNGNELIFATPANRIGIYSNLSSPDGTYSITKLRSDTLKGVLTSLAVLPLNRMILTGNDSGNIVLLC